MRIFLFTLNALVFLFSLLVGLFLISRPDGTLFNLSPGLLPNNLFKDYSIPGLLLLMTVGMFSLISLMFQITSNKKMYRWTLISGLILMAWIFVQHLMINSIIWSDYFLFIFSLLMILISLQLLGKELI